VRHARLRQPGLLLGEERRRRELVGVADDERDAERAQRVAVGAREVEVVRERAAPEHERVGRREAAAAAVRRPPARRGRALREAEHAQRGHARPAAAGRAAGHRGRGRLERPVEVAQVVDDLGVAVLARHPRGAHARRRAGRRLAAVDVEARQRLGRHHEPTRPRAGVLGEVAHEVAGELPVAVQREPHRARAGRVARRVVARRARHHHAVLPHAWSPAPGPPADGALTRGPPAARPWRRGRVRHGRDLDEHAAQLRAHHGARRERRGEGLAVHRVERRPVVGAGEVHGHAHHVGERGARGLEHAAQVGERLPGLGGHVALADELAGGRIARHLAGDEHEVAGAHRGRVRALGRRRGAPVGVGAEGDGGPAAGRGGGGLLGRRRRCHLCAECGDAAARPGPGRPPVGEPHRGGGPRAWRAARQPNGMPLYLDQLETPAAVVDLDRLALNLDRMAAYCAVHGLRLRPHVKTHKAPRIAAEQLRLGAAGLTVATVREAEVMSELTDDLLLAYPLVGTTALRRFTNIAPSVRLAAALDSREAAARLTRRRRRSGRPVHVLVELDVGMRRTGVAGPAGGVPSWRRSSPTSRRCATTASPSTRATCGRPARAGPGDGRVVRRQVEATPRGARPRGSPARVVSGGSTPGRVAHARVPGLTEVRPGPTSTTTASRPRWARASGTRAPSPCSPPW
jgi:hypothetical protein